MPEDKLLYNVAYLGLGIMGGAMASHLAKAGHKVFAWNRTPGRPGADLASEAGATICSTAEEAVKGVRFVFLCLSDASDIKELLLGENGIAKHAWPGTIFIDMSTTGIQCAQELASKLESMGYGFLDAPVSGGDIGAKNATLTIMVGGKKTDFETVLPLLECLGKNITYCGDSGAGQAIKLCNQILCAVNMVSITEAIHFAKALDIDPQLVVDVCGTGAGGSWALTNLGPKIIQNNFEPGFMLKHMLKDLGLVKEAFSTTANANHIQNQLLGTLLAVQKFQKVAEKPDGMQLGTQSMITAYGDND